RQFSEYADLIWDLLVRTAGSPRIPATVQTAPTPLPETLAPGERPMPAVPGYEVLEELGRGGMGVVYRARQTALNRVVALKMILAGQLASQDDVERFRREARTAAGLRHPGIVAIHEIGAHDGQHFFSMDFVEGQSLAELIRQSPLAPERAVRYVETVARAIQFAHEKEVLHRDLKPGNILIDRFDQPQVTDF